MRGTGFRSAVERAMVGDTKTSMVRVDHLGWLRCDGRSLLKSEYRALFSVLGSSFGSVDANHFNLPDAEGRVVGLIGRSTGNTWVDGDLSGEETHTLVIAEIPAHNHDISGLDPSANGFTSRDLTSISIDPSGQHNHGGRTGETGSAPESETTAAGIYTGPIVAGSNLHSHTIDPDGQHAHTVTDPGHRHQIASNGGSQPHNNIQPTIYMGNLFIYCGRVIHNVTDADGINPPVSNISYYPPSVPANRLY